MRPGQQGRAAGLLAGVPADSPACSLAQAAAHLQKTPCRLLGASVDLGPMGPAPAKVPSVRPECPLLGEGGGAATPLPDGKALSPAQTRRGKLELSSSHIISKNKNKQVEGPWRHQYEELWTSAFTSVSPPGL